MYLFQSHTIIAIVLAIALATISIPVLAVDISDASKKSGINAPAVESFGFGKTPGYLLMPIPIVDPTIGNGLALGAMFTLPADSDQHTRQTNSYTVGGFYTDTGSWAIGLQEQDYFLDDSLRLSTALVHGQFNLKYYGSSADSPLADNPMDYSLKGTFLKPRLLLRLFDSNFFLGSQLTVSRIKTKLDEFTDEIPQEDIDDKTYGLGVVGQYDSRDNAFSATQGSYTEVTYDVFDRARHSGFSYKKMESFYNYYATLNPGWVAVFQAQADFSHGDVPFYALPYINLRGFPAGRYIAQNAASLQTELRWTFANRWGALAFVGAGKVADDIRDYGDSETIGSYGLGVRFMASVEDRINLGIDLASGPDDTAIYFRIGEAF